MARLLANENISQLTVDFLHHTGYDIKSVREVGLQGFPDEEILSFANKEGRVIVTFDLDFGEIYYFSSKAHPGIIVLRLKSYWLENVNAVLLKLLESGKLETEEFENSLLIVSEDRYRIRKK